MRTIGIVLLTVILITGCATTKQVCKSPKAVIYINGERAK